MRGSSFFLAITLSLFGCDSSHNGWEDLFNGEDLSGWHTYGKGNTFNGWSVKNGILEFNPGPGTELGGNNLITDRQFTNFELSLEWKISDRGNAGIFYSVVESPEYSHAYTTGPEIQILDDHWTEYIEERGDITRAGALYNILAPNQIVSRPANIWNHFLLHIDHQKNTGFLEFNGKEVLRFPVNGEEWEELMGESMLLKMPDLGKAQTGHIVLQDWGAKVAFRDIEIRVLP